MLNVEQAFQSDLGQGVRGQLAETFEVEMARAKMEFGQDIPSLLGIPTITRAAHVAHFSIDETIHTGMELPEGFLEHMLKWGGGGYASRNEWVTFRWGVVKAVWNTSSYKIQNVENVPQAQIRKVMAAANRLKFRFFIDELEKARMQTPYGGNNGMAMHPRYPLLAKIGLGASYEWTDNGYYADVLEENPDGLRKHALGLNDLKLSLLEEIGNNTGEISAGNGSCLIGPYMPIHRGFTSSPGVRRAENVPEIMVDNRGYNGAGFGNQLFMAEKPAGLKIIGVPDIEGGGLQDQGRKRAPAFPIVRSDPAAWRSVEVDNAATTADEKTALAAASFVDDDANTQGANKTGVACQNCYLLDPGAMVGFLPEGQPATRVKIQMIAENYASVMAVVFGGYRLIQPERCVAIEVANPLLGMRRSVNAGFFNYKNPAQAA